MKYLPLILLMLSGVSQAVVNYQNGNYYQEFIDLNVPLKNSTLQFKRTYNSASTFPGMFGRGWGSSFETSMTMVDGAIIVKEMGNGRHHFYIPKGDTLDKAVAPTLAKIQEKTQLKGDALENFKNRLLMDPQALENEASAGKMDPAVKEYQNLNNPFLKLTVDKGLVSFHDSEGGKWIFTTQGELKTWTHPQGVKFEAKHDGKKLVSLFSPDVFIQFERDQHGHLKSIKYGRSQANYKVLDGWLKESTDQEKHRYTYDYEKERLVKIKGPDIAETISYQLTGEVAKVDEGNGKSTSFSFSSTSGANPIKKVEVAATDEPKKTFEYENRVGRQGPYLYRRKITTGKHVEEVVFDDCCGRPLNLKDGRSENQFKYNDKGYPTWMKTSDGKTHTWQWNEKDQIVKYEGQNEVRTYEYDNQGLVKVISKQSGTLTLKRGPGAKITDATLADSSGQIKNYKFVYGQDGKSMTLITSSGRKSHMKLSGNGEWVLDDKQSKDLVANMELLSWLQIHERLTVAPDPQSLVPTI